MENMKKTKKFLLDEKSTNEETLDKEFLEEESLDEEESEEETLEERTNTVKTWIVLIILSIVGICFMINFFNTCCTGEKTYHEKECDWCGRFEECKMYTVSYVNGYNIMVLLKSITILCGLAMIAFIKLKTVANGSK